MLKKFVFIAAIGYTLSLLSVCLVSLKGAPKVEIAYGDKIFHFLAYCMLTLLWVYTFVLNFKWTKRRSILISGIGAIIFGIFIEVLQGSVTTSRAFDYYDILANSLGALLTSLVLIKKQEYILK